MKHETKFTLAIITICFLLLIGSLFSGCQSMPVSQENAPPLTEKPSSNTRVALSWENTTEAHPERKPWSDYLVSKITQDKETFFAAKDIQTFCPKFSKISESLKIKAFSEMFVALAYYESGYNPKSASVDVGSQDQRDTWSIGLFQMSVVDQKNYGLALGYKYADLITAEPNIHLATAVMVRQIKKRGVIVVPSAPYWATLYHGKYDKIDSIASRVKSKVPECQ